MGVGEGLGLVLHIHYKMALEGLGDAIMEYPCLVGGLRAPCLGLLDLVIL